ncbi:hypothetical protein OBV_04940 [Oscillibacter valericigenes Sjm18-20]|nr:hypothetical protein OBV_04940 [Oscillibacter valericigenes Sjm18-20]
MVEFQDEAPGLTVSTPECSGLRRQYCVCPSETVWYCCFTMTMATAVKKWYKYWECLWKLSGKLSSGLNLN